MAEITGNNESGNRARGWLLAVLGPLLSGAMAVISIYLWKIIRFPVPSGGSPRWTGSPEMTANTFWLFGTIFAFGLVCTAAGISMIRTGRKNTVFVVLILALFAVMIYFGYAIMPAGR